MKQELALGIGMGVFAYLWVAGYNILPLGLLLGLAWVLWKVVIQRQTVHATGTGKRIKTTKIEFADIGGQKAAKQELQEALDFLLYSDQMKNLGIRPLKGILLSGPPGTGKTLLAKAAARYTNSAFLAVSGSEFVQMYAGVGAERVRALFRRADEMAKRENKEHAIIFIDELDILGAKRGTNISHHEYDQTLNQLLVQMDGLDTSGERHILVIGATNRIESLDHALMRPGRFDRHVRVDLPDKDGRLAILEIHTANKPLANDVELEKIAQETFGFSGAHLESVANEAAVFALREQLTEIKQKHFSEAIEKVMLGEKLDRKPTPEELWRIAVHESGHALLAEHVRPNTVAQVSIRSRGNALGYVRHYPENELYLYTQTMLEEQIMIALAGALAEEQVLCSRSTGAAGDYEQALNLVEQMLRSGMSSLGVVNVSQISREQRQQVSQEIFQRLETQTEEILERKKERLMRVAEILREKELLGGDDLRSVLS